MAEAEVQAQKLGDEIKKEAQNQAENIKQAAQDEAKSIIEDAKKKLPGSRATSIQFIVPLLIVPFFVLV